jgi:hypothetical protein
MCRAFAIPKAASWEAHRLTEGQARRGANPTAVFGNSGKELTILYEGTDDDKFWFVEGSLDRNGQLVGKEQLLDMGFEQK